MCVRACACACVRACACVCARRAGGGDAQVEDLVAADSAPSTWRTCARSSSPTAAAVAVAGASAGDGGPGVSSTRFSTTTLVSAWKLGQSACARRGGGQPRRATRRKRRRLAADGAGIEGDAGA